MTSEYTPIAINSKVETEEVLGPLPENWEKAPWGKTGRSYFVDHNSKTTTWVDPRTYYLRKHDIRDIVEGELPYAWEEVFDEVCGVYYIDHITQTHFLDAPWTDAVKEQVIALHDKLNEESDKLKEQMAQQQEMANEMEVQKTKLEALESEKERLEREIASVQNLLTEPENADNEELTSQEAHLQQELELVNHQLEVEREEQQRLNDEHDRLTREIEEFQTRLKELQAVNERLENDNKDFSNEVEENNEAVGEMRNLIEMEVAQRQALEAYIKQLKMEVLELYNPEEAESARQKEQEDENDVVDAPLPQPGEADEATQLKQRLANEQQEAERLKKLTDTLEAERARIQEEIETGYELPSWVKDLDINAEASVSVRVKVSKNVQDQDGHQPEVEA